MTLLKYTIYLVIFFCIVFLGMYVFARPTLQAYESTLMHPIGLSLSSVDSWMASAGLQNTVVTLQSTETWQSVSQQGAVLGSAIQESDQEPPLHEKAIEYAQYQYCKQVISEYEQQ